MKILFNWFADSMTNQHCVSEHVKSLGAAGQTVDLAL